ncbi:MAG: hypothetical protein H6619_03010 [Deltaproteobacteria bacterium]|nr:hypothetical protein [Deltaproteobacteria bacterium]
MSTQRNKEQIIEFSPSLQAIPEKFLKRIQLDPETELPWDYANEISIGSVQSLVILTQISAKNLNYIETAAKVFYESVRYMKTMNQYYEERFKEIKDTEFLKPEMMITARNAEAMRQIDAAVLELRELVSLVNGVAYIADLLRFAELISQADKLLRPTVYLSVNDVTTALRKAQAHGVLKFRKDEI